MNPEDRVEKIQLLNGTDAVYGGVIVEMNEDMDSQLFVSALRASVSRWKEQGKFSVWLKLPIELVNLVEAAVKEGFRYHHAEPSYLMLVQWIGKTADTLPINASHRVGIGALVLKQTGEVLVVQEGRGKFKGTGVWKLPTGVVNEGEDICAAAIREVEEETGIETEFLEVLAFRQSHQSFFTKSDLFFVCYLRPLSFHIQKEDSEIEAAKWMPIEEYVALPFNQKHEQFRFVADLCLAKSKNSYTGFSAVPATGGLSAKRRFLYFNCKDSCSDQTDMASSDDQSTAASSQSHSVRSKTDIGWNHCTEVSKGVLKCLYCSKTFNGGGINRFKKHIAGIKGDVKSCEKVSYDIRFEMQENIKSIEANKKKEANTWEEEIQFDRDIPNVQELPHAQHQSQAKCPVVSSSQRGERKASGSLNAYFAPRTTAGAQPSIKSVLAGKEAVKRADLAVARFFYDTCIPINTVNSVYFQPMIDAIAAIGPSYKGPSYNSLRTNLLLDMKNEVRLTVDACRSAWKENGCTLMADGWQTINNRQLINFIIYCSKGLTFVKSVDASDVVKDAQTLCNLFVELVEFAGPSNVVHFVTDNAANYKAAGRLLNDRYPSIFWSPCATHCLNLILSDIGKMELVNGLASCASLVTKFVYNHAYLLAWLRKRVGWTEIVRPGPTRFATTFIALKSIHEHRHDLQALATSKTFLDSKYSKTQKANETIGVILDNKFWNDCSIIVKIVAPLIRLLRIVDGDDRPSLGYVYEGMYRVRRAIKNVFMNKKSLYKPYTRIIKQRWDKQLRQKLHVAAYVLNPCFRYDKDNFSLKPEVQQGFLEVLEARVKSNKKKFLAENILYHDRQESFSSSLALECSKEMHPDEWWKTFGQSAPMVKQMAIELLSQTASSSGCERNWSVFERIHTKKRNRLEHQRLNDLVFVHYNLRLKNRAKNKKACMDPIDYESIDKIEYWVVEDDNPPDLDYEELERMLYDDQACPVIDITQDEGDIDQSITRDGEHNLESFPQEDVDSYSGNEYGDIIARHGGTDAWFNQDEDPPNFNV